MINFNPVYGLINDLGKNVQKPNNDRNYTLYDKNRVDSIAQYGSSVIPYLENYLNQKRNDNEVFEALCVIDKMADNMTPDLYKMYPVLSKYNDTNSPEIQVMLSGIYRKTLLPDAFGPLCRMFYKQVTNPDKGYFDPSEETGGAILEYIKSYGNSNNYPAFFLNAQRQIQYNVPYQIATDAYRGALIRS